MRSGDCGLARSLWTNGEACALMTRWWQTPRATRSTNTELWMGLMDYLSQRKGEWIRVLLYQGQMGEESIINRHSVVILLCARNPAIHKPPYLEKKHMLWYTSEHFIPVPLPRCVCLWWWRLQADVGCGGCRYGQCSPHQAPLMAMYQRAGSRPSPPWSVLSSKSDRKTNQIIKKL